MALLKELENQGNFLFKYRGQFPIVLFILAIPFVYVTAEVSNEWEFVFTFISIVLSLIGFLIRAYTIGTTPKGTSGRNTKEQLADELNFTGIYSLVRHPLYLGNYLMWIGIVLFTFNLMFVLVVSLLFCIYYERIMFAEERFLEKKFGATYVAWANQLPAFIPSFKNYQKSAIPFSLISVLRREYSGVLATVIGFSYVHLIRVYLHFDSLFLSKGLTICLVASSVLAIVLRTIKRKTNLLEEHGRF